MVGGAESRQENLTHKISANSVKLEGGTNYLKEVSPPSVLNCFELLVTAEDLTENFGSCCNQLELEGA